MSGSGDIAGRQEGGAELELITRECIYRLEEPVLGTYPCSPLALEEEVDRFLGLLEEGRKQGRGLFFVLADPVYEPAVIYFLCRARSRLRKAGATVSTIIRPLNAACRDDRDSDYLLAHKSDTLPGFESLLLEVIPAGKTVIATLLGSSPQDTCADFSPLVFRLPSAPGDIDQFEREYQKELSTYRELPPKALKAYRAVTLSHSLGIVFPFSLLAKISGLNEESAEKMVDDSPELFYWVEREMPPGLFVGVKGQYLASLVAGEFGGNEIERLPGLLVSRADPGDRDHRLFLQLFLHRLAGREPLAAGEVLAANGDKLQDLLARGDSLEKLNWAGVYRASRRRARQIEILADALAHDPKNICLRHDLAKAHAEAGNYSAAERAFSALLRRELEPRREIYVRQARGVMRAARGPKYREKAEADFRSALEITHPSPHALVAYGNLKLKRGDHDGAAVLFRRVLDLHSNDVHALCSLGILQKDRLNYREAFDHFRAAIEIDPANIPARNALGIAYRDRGHLFRAEETLREAHRIDGHNLQCLQALAGVLIENNAGPEAEQLLEHALELDPDSTHVRLCLGVMEKKRGNFKGAAGHFECALRVDDRNPFIYAAWADLCARRGFFAMARECFDKALEISGRKNFESVPIYNSMAGMYHRRGWHKRAERCIQRSLELLGPTPGLRKIITLNAAADIETDLGNYPRAEAIYREALRMDPENTYTLRACARMLELSGRPREARIFGKKASREQSLELDGRETRSREREAGRETDTPFAR